VAWLGPQLRASNECWSIWFISSISSIWLVGPEIHPEEPDRPERPANQTDKPGALREHGGSTRLPPVCSGWEVYLIVKEVNKPVTCPCVECNGAEADSSEAGETCGKSATGAIRRLEFCHFELNRHE